MSKRNNAPLIARVPYPQTTKTAHAWLRANGITITDLARRNDLPRTVLADLLRGLSKGHRGQAHLGAIALGLKPEPKAVRS